ncbi:MAG: nuclear transport factor 2 family protein [Acidobacteria bacterium]|nr:nuclear transport factor 2 family protein [Acidobacteriota bacterium]
MAAPLMTDEEAVKNLEFELIEACVKADLERLDHILADNFIFTDPDGLNLTKAQWLKGMESGQLIFEALQITALAVRIEKNIATASVHIRARINAQETRYHGDYSAMDIYEKRNGRWQAILSTANPVAAEG